MNRRCTVRDPTPGATKSTVRLMALENFRSRCRGSPRCDESRATTTPGGIGADARQSCDTPRFYGGDTLMAPENERSGDARGEGAGRVCRVRRELSAVPRPKCRPRRSFSFLAHDRLSSIPSPSTAGSYPVNKANLYPPGAVSVSRNVPARPGQNGPARQPNDKSDFQRELSLPGQNVGRNGG